MNQRIGAYAVTDRINGDGTRLVLYDYGSGSPAKYNYRGLVRVMIGGVVDAIMFTEICDGKRVFRARKHPDNNRSMSL